MRTPIEALKEIRDRLTYFCLRTDGKYDPPWATELVGITDEALTESRAIGNAAAMSEALVGLIDGICFHCDMSGDCKGVPCEKMQKAKAALSKPPRNCDLPLVVDGPADNNADKAWLVFKRHNPDAYFDISGLFRCMEWLLAPAAERKGEGDGR